jgi:uncharacterized protein with von Willebrand factor type A (vWA) domain
MAGRQEPTARQQEPVRLELDLAALAGAMGQRLHDAGMSVTPDQSQQYVMSLQLVRPSTLRKLYFTSRSIFVTDADEVATFDRVFAQVFGATGSRPGADDGEAAAYAETTPV